MPSLAAWLVPLVIAHGLAAVLCLAALAAWFTELNWLQQWPHILAWLQRTPARSARTTERTSPLSSTSDLSTKHSSPSSSKPAFTTVSQTSTASQVLLEWHRVSAQVQHRGSDGSAKTLLKDVSGRLCPGELHCLLGPSGAGKSTLLGLLSQPPSQLTRASTQHTPAPQRTRRGQALVITGQVRSPCADGPAQSVPAPHKAAVRSAQEKAQPHCSKPIVCLIAQHDLLLPALTTRETLQWMQQMSAAGRGAARPGPAALAAETSALLDRLGLNSSSETQVGGVLSGGYMLRGLSGGERKRLAIACALVQAHMMTAICAPTPTPAWPMVTQRHADIQDTSHALSLASTVLLCDESTSGLDSACALSILTLLRSLAHLHTHSHTPTHSDSGQSPPPPPHLSTAPRTAGGAVLVALHQPRPALWALFDTVSVLTRGRLLYTGPTTQAVSWLTHAVPEWGPYVPAVHGSVAEFLIEVACYGLVTQHGNSNTSDDSKTSTDDNTSLISGACSKQQAACGSSSSSTTTQQGAAQHGSAAQCTAVSSHGDMGAGTASPVMSDNHRTHEEQVTHAADVFTQLLDTHGLAWWCGSGASNSSSTVDNKDSSHPATKAPCSAAQDSTSGRHRGTEAHMHDPAVHDDNNTSSTEHDAAVLQTDVHLDIDSTQHYPLACKEITPSHNSPDTDKPATTGADHMGPVLGVPVRTPGNGHVLCRVEHSVAAGRGAGSARARIEVVATVGGPEGTGLHIRTHAQLTVGDDETTTKRHTPACSALPLLLHRLLTCMGGAWRPLGAPMQRMCFALQGAVGHTVCGWRQSGLLAWREWVQTWRSGPATALKILLFSWSGFVLGLVFYGLDTHVGYTGVSLRSSALFMTTSVLTSMPYASLLALTQDLAHSRQEMGTGLYGVGPHLLSKLAATLPQHIINTLCFTTIAAGLQGLGRLPTWDQGQQAPVSAGVVLVFARTCHMSGLAVLLVMCSAQVMHLALTLCPSPDTAFMVTTAWCMVNIYFSGFFFDPNVLTFKWLAPVKHMSAIRLAFQGMLTAEFQGAAVPCTGTQSALLDTFQSLLPNLLPHLQPQLTAAAAAARAAGAAAAGAANRSTSAARSLRTLLSSTVQHSNADTVPQQGISLGLSAMTSPLHALMSSMAHNSDNVTDAYTVGGRSLLHTQPPAPLSAAMSGPRLGSPAGISAGLSSAAAAVAGGLGSDAGCWVQGDTVLRALNVGSSAANQLIGLCVYYTGLLVLTWLCMVMLARRRSRQAHT